MASGPFLLPDSGRIASPCLRQKISRYYSIPHATTPRDPVPWQQRLPGQRARTSACTRSATRLWPCSRPRARVYLNAALPTTSLPPLLLLLCSGVEDQQWKRDQTLSTAQPPPTA